jgi:hypothetical protein
MHLVVIMKLSTALLKMLDPIETCILNPARKAALNLSSLDICYK